MSEKCLGLSYSKNFYFPLANGSLESEGKGAQKMLSMNVNLLWHKSEQQRWEYECVQRAVNVTYPTTLKCADLASEFLAPIFNCLLAITTWITIDTCGIQNSKMIPKIPTSYVPRITPSFGLWRDIWTYSFPLVRLCHVIKVKG